MSLAFNENVIYTYKDYASWNDDERWELIQGIPYCMSPAPSRMHQEISRNLFVKFANYLDGKQCKVYYSPFDVRIPIEGASDDNIINVVQPDIVVICDKNKLDDKGCIGSPDLIIEIISPSTAKKDLNEKFSLYEQAGVTEYWVVYPYEKIIFIYSLVNGKYNEGIEYDVSKSIAVGIFDKLSIDLKDIFKE